MTEIGEMAEKPGNEEIAQVLERIAGLLEAQGANVHRVRAYRDGAQRVREAGESLAGLVRRGEERALLEIPGIGERLGGLIFEYVRTGRSGLLERLQGEVTPESLFTQIPGIGPELAREIERPLPFTTGFSSLPFGVRARLLELGGDGLEISSKLRGDVTLRTSIRSCPVDRPSLATDVPFDELHVLVEDRRHSCRTRVRRVDGCQRVSKKICVQRLEIVRERVGGRVQRVR